MRPRILYPFAGDTIGGSHLSTLEIIGSLNQSDYDPIIVLHETKGLLARRLESLNYPYEGVADIAYPPSPSTLVKSVLAARRYLKKRGIALVHCDDGPLRYIWLYAAKLAGAKYVHVQRTLLRPSLEKCLSYRLMNAVIANSKTTQRSLPPLPSSIMQKVIYPPVVLKYGPDDKAANRKAVLETLYLKEDKNLRLVIFAANIHERKRPDIFIKMAVRLRAESAFDCKFILIGSFFPGMEERLMRLAADNDIESHVFFKGFQQDSQKFISAADILVAPAVDEAFGRSVAEAMGLGTPVVASAAGGHEEIIKDCADGLFAIPDRPEDFAKKACRILREDNFSALLVRNALERARMLSRDRAAASFEEVYSALLFKKGL